MENLVLKSFFVGLFVIAILFIAYYIYDYMQYQQSVQSKQFDMTTGIEKMKDTYAQYSVVLNSLKEQQDQNRVLLDKLPTSDTSITAEFERMDSTSKNKIEEVNSLLLKQKKDIEELEAKYKITGDRIKRSNALQKKVKILNDNNEILMRQVNLAAIDINNIGSKLWQQINKINENNTQLTTDINHLHDRSVEINTQKIELIYSRIKYRKEVNKLVDSIVGINTYIRTLNEHISKQINNFNDLRAINVSTTRGVSVLNTNYEDNNQDIQRMKLEVENTVKLRDTLNSKIQEIRMSVAAKTGIADLDSTMAKIKSQLESANQYLNQCKKSLQDLKDSNTAIKSTITQLNSDIEKTNQDIELLDQKFETIDGKTTSLNTTNNTIESRLGSVSTSQNSTSTTITSLTEKYNELQSKVQQYNSEENQSTIDNADNITDQYEKKVDDMDKNLKNIFKFYDNGSAINNNVYNHQFSSSTTPKMDLRSSVSATNGFTINTSEANNEKLKICQKESDDICVHINVTDNGFNITPNNVGKFVINSKNGNQLANFDMDQGNVYLGGTPEDAPLSIRGDTAYVKNHTDRRTLDPNFQYPTLPENIDKKGGWYKEVPVDNFYIGFQTEEDCRQRALSGGDQYVAWGFRNKDHDGVVDDNGNHLLKNTCFLYKNIGPYFGPDPNNSADAKHSVGCVKPGDKLDYGCQSPKVFIFEHVNKKGVAKSLDVGTYTDENLNNMGFQNIISSIVVPPGYIVSLYKNNNFDASNGGIISTTVIDDFRTFGANDNIKSIKVKTYDGNDQIAKRMPVVVGSTFVNIPGTKKVYAEFTSLTGNNTITFFQDTVCDILVIGGGGGGGNNGGGGGGAGGLIYAENVTLNGEYSITVGNGGDMHTNGQNTLLKKGATEVYKAIGGGGARAREDESVNPNGGSGGGGGSYQKTVAGNGTSGQGHNGGNGFDGNRNSAGGGGGGAGAAGTAAVSQKAGNGGDGRVINIKGTDVHYSGGGAGGYTLDGVPGNPGKGYENYGGGGNGGRGVHFLTPPSSGRQGVVIIRFTEDTQNASEYFEERGSKHVLPYDISKVKGFGGGGLQEGTMVQNQTEEDCRQLALQNESTYKAWGHRNDTHPDGRYKNTCFLYNNNFNGYTGNNADNFHTTGCLRPGEKVEWGCESKVPDRPVPGNISKVKGFGGGGLQEGTMVQNQTEEDCRQLALQNESIYKAWGHRNDTHPNHEWKDTCYLYTNDFKGYTGNNADNVHTTGCLRPGEKVEWGCDVIPKIVGSQFKKIANTQYAYVEFTKTSGTQTIKFEVDTECDVLLIGGGGGGGGAFSVGKEWGGGYIGTGGYGGGFVETKVKFLANIEYTIIVGNGGRSMPKGSNAENRTGGTASIIKQNNRYISKANGGNPGYTYWLRYWKFSTGASGGMNGKPSSITGVEKWYAAAGGNGSGWILDKNDHRYANGKEMGHRPGGKGGGGNPGSQRSPDGKDAVANTGSGGGGAAAVTVSHPKIFDVGGKGADGIVIIRWKVT